MNETIYFSRLLLGLMAKMHVVQCIHLYVLQTACSSSMYTWAIKHTFKHILVGLLNIRSHEFMNYYFITVLLALNR